MSQGPGIRPSIDALPHSLIDEIARYGRGRDGMIPLWFGEGDVPTPDFVMDAANQAMREGHVFYTWQRGLPELRDALAAYHRRTYGMPVDADRITVTGSGMTAISLSIQSLIDPGDEVVIVSPVWPNVFASIEIMGGVVRQVPLTLGNAGWTLDLDRLFDACGSRTKMIFINSPCNPTGWTMGTDDMRRVMKFARERGLWVMSDEVYSRMVYDGSRAPSFLDVSEPEDRLLVINSFSKNWAMTGWRLGWVVSPSSFGPVYEKMVQFNNSGVPGFVQKAGIAALEQGDGFLADMVERCRTGRDIVCGVLESLPRVKVQRPDAAFYAFFSVEGETDSLTLAKRIVDEAQVGLAPGAAFGEGGEGYLRLCFASSPARLKVAMERMAPVLS
ncbi:aspartate/methionine/tyrosine aminotransferase [Skermanella aerolata]|uniref:Aminotransferase n=1 Tax=Skermanella aerolata TaxID=393310 RepID=A0A512DP61_9PROT|nr:pyridoxal phosphate-dependent aminotransferase [Skermanella aerolata]KJB95721.1 aspartate aminotransferase [Skermanella aerolata KACC 11604]GEO38274.1 aminotransferase [Skermanella aerolata]